MCSKLAQSLVVCVGLSGREISLLASLLAILASAEAECGVAR